MAGADATEADAGGTKCSRSSVGLGDEVKEVEGIFDVDPAQAAVLAALLTKAVGEHYDYDRRGKEPPIQIAFGFGETPAPFVRVRRQRSRVSKATR